MKDFSLLWSKLRTSFVIIQINLQAQPLFKDKRKFHLMADPLLEGNYPTKGLYQALAVAAMCLQEEASTRPLISDVVTALEFLSTGKLPPDDVEDSGAPQDAEKKEADGDWRNALIFQRISENVHKIGSKMEIDPSFFIDSVFNLIIGLPRIFVILVNIVLKL